MTRSDLIRPFTTLISLNKKLILKHAMLFLGLESHHWQKLVCLQIARKLEIDDDWCRNFFMNMEIDETSNRH
jgi:hypothetical protein